MKHLVIKNLGPLKEVDIELDDLNVIIGAQSTGKSCVLKMACYCSWVEKRIMLTQALDFYSGKQFINDFVSYYKMHGYIKPNTYVLYESPYLKFDYQENKQEDNFTHIKKKNFWQYKRPKLTYVPTERNVVSLFPDFEKLPNTGNHIQDFMIDWKTARNYKSSSDNILGMGFDYRYDKASNTDFVTTSDSTELELTNTSSGIQSLLPLFMHLNFVTNLLYQNGEYNLQNLTIDKKEEVQQLLDFLYKRIGVPANAKKEFVSSVRLNNQTLKFWFSKETDKEKFEGYVTKLLYNNHTEIFLEEPENNLFPPTQARLLDWVLDNTIFSSRNDILFVATHSPYILSKLLEKDTGNVKFFFTYPKRDGMYVKTASQDDISNILAYGVDMFFNFETFI